MAGEQKSFVLLEDWWICAEYMKIETLAAVRVYMFLRTCRNHKTGKTYIGCAKIAKACKLSRRSVTRAIEELTKLCLIEVGQTRHSTKQKYSSNEYMVYDQQTIA